MSNAIKHERNLKQESYINLDCRKENNILAVQSIDLPCNSDNLKLMFTVILINLK